MNSIRWVALMLMLTIHTSLVFAGWEHQQSGVTTPIDHVHFATPLRGWAMVRESSFFLSTRDGGKTWDKQTCPLETTPGNPKRIYSMQLLTENMGFIGTNGGRLFSTQDWGVTWQTTVIEDDSLSGVTDIAFIDSENGWITLGHSYGYTGVSPIRYRTTDGGKTWELLPNWEPSLSFVKFLDARTGWGITGMSTTNVFRTDDGGENWEMLYTFKKFPPCNELTIISPDTLWITAPFLSISTDGGYTWNEGLEPIAGLCMTDRTHYWKRRNIVDKETKVLHTDISYTVDAGKTFNQILYTPQLVLSDMFGLNNGMLWMVGKDGLIMKYTPDQLEVNDEISLPHDYELYQNSPNPFNASTVIRFSSSVRNKVKISVYDVTGKLVRTLVDKDYSPGTHTVAWEGNDNHGKEVSSGVFFYHLSSGSSTITKKMMLMK